MTEKFKYRFRIPLIKASRDLTKESNRKKHSQQRERKPKLSVRSEHWKNYKIEKFKSLYHKEFNFVTGRMNTFPFRVVNRWNAGSKF